MNKFWQIFFTEFFVAMDFCPKNRIKIKNIDLDQYFIKALYSINNGYEKVRNEH